LGCCGVGIELLEVQVVVIGAGVFARVFWPVEGMKIVV
jgi:hypothetical protein